VFATLQVYLGGFYVTISIALAARGKSMYKPTRRFGQTPVRSRDEVTTATGEVIPLGTLVKMRDVGGPLVVTRYNMFSRSDGYRRRAAKRE